MSRLLLLATTTGYQTREFGEAADRLGVELVFATDRCHVLEDPWRDAAIPIRFFDVAASVQAIVEAAKTRPLDGILVVGDRPATLAAAAAEALGLAGHPPEAARVAGNKQLTRERLRSAGLPVPWFRAVSLSADVERLARSVSFPCVVKPLALSGSRGVMRADDPVSFGEAFIRLRTLLESPALRAEHDDAHGTVLIEGFVPGHEFAVEGVMQRGRLKVLAVFDKPDPLDGPFFEETVYLTPPLVSEQMQASIVDGVFEAASAIGLSHGPIHAECRVNERGVFVLEVAARPIGGLCSRILKFRQKGVGSPLRRPAPNSAETATLEELLLRQALGESLDPWEREPLAAGVMMLPIPRRGIFRGVLGLEDARALAGIDDIRITAKADQLLLPLPEGASYLGFIFARGESPGAVDRTLRAAQGRLQFRIDSEVPMLQSHHG